MTTALVFKCFLFKLKLQNNVLTIKSTARVLIECKINSRWASSQIFMWLLNVLNQYTTTENIFEGCGEKISVLAYIVKINYLRKEYLIPNSPKSNQSTEMFVMR